MVAAGGLFDGGGWVLYGAGAVALMAWASTLLRLLPLGLYSLVQQDPPWSALPIGAGAWLEEQLVERGLDDVVVAMSEGGENGAASVHGVIHLEMDVWRGRTIEAWATAAHELGHIVSHRMLGPLAWPLLAPRAAESVAQLGVGLLLTNLVLLEPAVTAAAIGCLVAALLLHSIVVVEELAVSLWAVRLLRSDPRVPAQVGTTRSGLVDSTAAARRVLGRGWASYVAQLVAYAGLVASLPLFTAWMAHRPDLTWRAPPLSSWTEPLATTVVVLAALQLGWALLGLLAPRWPSFGDDEVRTALIQLGRAAFVGLLYGVQGLLVWSVFPHGPDATAALPLALATAPFALSAASLGSVPMVVLLGAAVWWASSKLMSGARSDRSDPVRAPEPSDEEMAARTERLKGALSPRRRWVFVSRAAQLLKVVGLPLALYLLLS